MTFQKLHTPSLKELFVKELETRILSGRLAIGEKLPPERELAASMEVSRAVINGGITELAQKGFLIIKPRIGTFVADYRKEGTLETLISIMNYNGGTLKNTEIASILEVRLALDSLALRLGIPRMSEADITELSEITENIRQAADIPEACRHAFAFQHQLAFLSGNTLIPLIFKSFEIPVATLWERFCQLYGISALYKNTDSLLTYIKQRDTDGAIAFLESYLEDTISGSRPIYYERG